MRPDSDEPSFVPIDDREAWRALVRHLLDTMPLARRPEDADALVDRVVRQHPGRGRAARARALESLADALNLTVSWRTGTVRDVSRAVVPDEVAIAWSNDGWVSVRRPVLRRRVEQGPWGTVPDGVTAWACLASAWPASSLAAGPAAGPWRRLVRLLGAERRDVGLIVAYGAGAALLTLAIPVTVQVLVNTVAFGAFRQPLFALTGLLFASLALAAFLHVLQRIVVETLQRRLFARVADDLSIRLPRVRLSTWDAASGPELVNRFFDIITVQKSLAILMIDGLGALVSAVVGLSLLAVYHPYLLGFDVLLLIGAAGVAFGLGIGGPEAAIIESKRKYALAEWLELLSARPDVFKHDGAGALAALRTSSATRSWLQAREAHFRIFLRQLAGAWGLQVIATTGLLGIGGWLVLEGQLTLGQLVAAEIVVASALNALVRFAGKLETLYDLLAAVDKLGNLLDLPLDPVGVPGRDAVERPVCLALRGVRLPRHGATLDLRIEAGTAQRVGLVDPLARRHLADLLVIARDPESGTVRVDDVDVCDAPRAALQARIALIRDPRPIPATLRDNLALGREDLDDDALREALAHVGLDERLGDLPHGLDTPLRSDDRRLSVDDRLRLAVARAVVGAPRLIVVDGVLDEASIPVRNHLLRVLTATDRTWTLVWLDARDDAATPHPLSPGPRDTRAA